MSERLASEQLFFDPFAAEEGKAEFFDPQVSHQAMWERYANDEVKHDYTADKFVADTEALMMDAQFVGQFEAAQAIAERMHMLCGEDHGLRASMEASSLLGNHPDDHDHNHNEQAHDEKDQKKSKKAKKKKFRGWFSLARD
ncbi:MAG TPA: hypothetical protein VHC21_04265 [Candidatus Saccharimonadales bacterium]|nr:hypothetical protein [Candidatus Saccharimonadales bacterium]